MPGKPFFLLPLQNNIFIPSDSGKANKGDQWKADFTNKITVFHCSAMDRDGSAKLERFHNPLEYSRSGNINGVVFEGGFFLLNFLYIYAPRSP